MKIQFKKHTFLNIWAGTFISRYVIVLKETDILDHIQSIDKIDKHHVKITFENGDYTAQPVDKDSFITVE